MVVPQPLKKATIHDIPRGHRIHIPQETISIERPVRPKITPSSYLYWLENPTNRVQVQDYQAFLTRNDVANIVPNYELLRTARDWQNAVAQNMPYLIVNYGITPFLHFVS